MRTTTDLYSLHHQGITYETGYAPELTQSKPDSRATSRFSMTSEEGNVTMKFHHDEEMFEQGFIPSERAEDVPDFYVGPYPLPDSPPR